MSIKNIIICSDGTGNRGGKGHGTNVWHLYNGINLRSHEIEQITHYDDGVGTDDNKYLRAFGGAFGWGFSKNVKRAYKFLIRNWNQDDHIYMFGFSRGAYTVRALAAFVAKCGVIDGAQTESEKEQNELINQLVSDYHNKRVDESYDEVKVIRPILIRMVGVWDTVSAIGLPFDILLKKLISKIFRFNFSDHNLSDNVALGMHALAIDDERRTFHPTLWNARKGIEQVWFSGVHSNVGGGYPKQEMSYVTLEWMLSKCKWNGTNGIVFDADFEEEVRRNANVHGRLYDSRAGAGAYYRYAPRDIGRLCRENNIKTVKIHQSVFDRIQHKTAAYNPGAIPADLPIEVIGESVSKVAQYQAKVDKTMDTRKKILEGSVPWVHKRKALHLAFVLLTLLTAGAFGQFLIVRPDAPEAVEACNCAVGLSGWWTYLIPAILAWVILVTLVYLKRLGRKALCLLALVVLAAFTFTLVGKPLPVWKFGDSISGLLAFLLPDILAAALEYFLDNYIYHTVSAVVAFLAMLRLRSSYRDKCQEVFEEACEKLRI